MSIGAWIMFVFGIVFLFGGLFYFISIAIKSDKEEKK